MTVYYMRDGGKYAGWYTPEAEEVFINPEMAGGKYYFDMHTGEMAVGEKVIDGVSYFFRSDGSMDQKLTDVQAWPVPDDVIDVWDYGANGEDTNVDGRQINAAIQAAKAGQTVYIPRGTYYFVANAGIQMKSHINLVMDRYAVLKVWPSANENYNIISMQNIENAHIFGGQIHGERESHSDNDGEYGMGVGIYDCKNVSLNYMTILSNWGDGVYLGTESHIDDRHGCDTVKIRHCTIVNNRRNNISIVDADNVIIDSCDIRLANGVDPQCEIFIEPNADENGKIPEDRVCKHIAVWWTTIEALKAGEGERFYCYATPQLKVRQKTADDVAFAHCVLKGDVANYSGSPIQVIDTKITGTVIQ